VRGRRHDDEIHGNTLAVAMSLLASADVVIVVLEFATSHSSRSQNQPPQYRLVSVGSVTRDVTIH